MKTAIPILIFIISGFYLFAQPAPVYKNASLPIAARVKDLLLKMTLEEKILQMNQLSVGLNSNSNNLGDEVKSIPKGIGSLIYFGSDPVFRNAIQKNAVEQTRLGIPVLFAFDVIHGFRTVYPISLGAACSWNPDLVEQACAGAAKEAKLSGIDWTFSPMIDVAHDPRWGRVAEGYGEDPYANSIFGVACVKGYQGKKLSDKYSIAACLKHYVGYSESEGGRDYSFSDISRQKLWDTYLPPYEAAVKSGAATVMSAFNDISGVPATANHYTLSEILKRRWKYKGFVVSDWDAINQLIAQGVAGDRSEAALKSFSAGVDMDMSDKVFLENLKNLIGKKKIAISAINNAVSRILTLKFKLGLFEHPYTPVIREELRYRDSTMRSVANRLAAESMVLLKNKNGVLPLSDKLHEVALIGPVAADKKNLLGAWAYNGKPSDVVSIKDGLEKMFTHSVKIDYAEGCDYDGIDTTGFASAIEAARSAQVILICLGEKKEWSGENASRSSISLPPIQEKLIKAVNSLNKPVILVLSNGRPLDLSRVEPLADGILEIWQPGTEGGSAIAKILTGAINPSGKLAMTFPVTSGQIPIYYNMRQRARPFGGMGDYQDITNAPMYSFGYGLSYTNFQYGKIKLSASKIKIEEKLLASVDVENIGKVNSSETVMWFISDPVCSVSRPVKELKFFEKKNIDASKSATYTFEIEPQRDLSYIDSEGKRSVEKGTFYVMLNGQKAQFEVIN